MSQGVLVGDIQRFCLHDGPGIRTTVFLKGCPLACPWCCNPEYMQGSVQELCDGRVCGTWMTPEDLFEEAMKDKAFFSRGGGVTFSGGEPLMQIHALRPVLEMLNAAGVDTMFETSLCVPEQNVQEALSFADRLYVDAKLLSEDDFRSILGASREQYLSNLALVASSGVRFTLRVPVIAGFTDGEDGMEMLKGIIMEHHPSKIEMLKGHNLGGGKHALLDAEGRSGTFVPEKEALERLAELAASQGVEAEVLEI